MQCILPKAAPMSLNEYKNDRIELSKMQIDHVKRLLKYRYFQGKNRAASGNIIVESVIWEEEQPPKIDNTRIDEINDFKVTLRRLGCEGRCPSYDLKLDQSGLVELDLRYPEFLVGKYRYNIGENKARNLLHSLISKNILGMREYSDVSDEERTSYSSNIIGEPVWIIIELSSGRSFKLLDNHGEVLGMPKAVRDFEEEIDKVAQITHFIDSPDVKDQFFKEHEITLKPY